MLGSNITDNSIQSLSADGSSQACRIPDEALRRMVEQAVGRVFAVGTSDLWSLQRGHPTAAFARQVAMYLAHVTCGLTLTDVGRLFARDRTTVAHASVLIEDRREEPRFDRALELLEGALILLSRHASHVH
jgi:chromosomal replication initiation ATPase DnaA